MKTESQPPFSPDNKPAAEPAPVPIVPGYEHFSLYVDDEQGPWPEFIPGYHVDSRQPTLLRGLCSPPEEKPNPSEPRIQNVDF